jgi:CBS domain-containing protein
MQSAPVLSQPGFHFDEPIRTLLRSKSPDLWSISPDSSVYEAIEKMSDKRAGALVVLSGEHLSGIVSERDYARKVILLGRNSRDTKVHEIMTAPVVFVTPRHTVDQCMRLMTTKRIRHLPVLENRSVTGMLSIGDLVNWIISAQDATIHQLQNYISGAYPG